MNNVKIGQIVVTNNDIGRVIRVGDCGSYTSEQIISKEAFVEAFEKWILPKVKMDMRGDTE